MYSHWYRRAVRNSGVKNSDCRRLLRLRKVEGQPDR